MICRITRRQFSAALGAAAVSPLLSGCGSTTKPEGFGSALLLTRPSAATNPAAPGTYQLGLGEFRDGLLYVPPQAAGGGSLGLLLTLHGGGGTAVSQIDFYRPDAAQRGYFLLAVEARGGTWDAINGHFSIDPPFIDQALSYTFARCRVDPNRIFLAGASDGATYGLGLGLANGDLFRRLMMFFPGSIAPSDSPRLGKPEIFIAHGTADTIFPVDRSREVTVPALRGEGYTVEYLEFDGGHAIPTAVAQTALDWLARP